MCISCTRCDVFCVRFLLSNLGIRIYIYLSTCYVNRFGINNFSNSLIVNFSNEKLIVELIISNIICNKNIELNLIVLLSIHATILVGLEFENKVKLRHPYHVLGMDKNAHYKLSKCGKCSL